MGYDAYIVIEMKDREGNWKDINIRTDTIGGMRLTNFLDELNKGSWPSGMSDRANKILNHSDYECFGYVNLSDNLRLVWSYLF